MVEHNLNLIGAKMLNGTGTMTNFVNYCGLLFMVSYHETFTLVDVHDLKDLVLQGKISVFWEIQLSALPQYMKPLILECVSRSPSIILNYYSFQKSLTHLDARTLFPRDKACAEAW